MTFLDPLAFWLLPPAALLFFLQWRGMRHQTLPVDPRLLIGSAGRPVWRRLQLFALLLMIVALARPVLERPSETAVPDAEPVYLAIDASYSMRADDLEPNRFAFARRVIDRLLQTDAVHAFGLMAFTSNALMLSPPTRDHALLHSALAMLDTNNIMTKSTDLKALLERVAKLPERTKRLVIFSDGGDENDLGVLQTICTRAGIVVYSVACASNTGSRIPTGEGGWLRDKKGNMIISVQNPLLQRLAESTGGKAVDAPEASAAATQLTSALSDTLFESTGVEKAAYTELFWIPLLLALLLYATSVLRLPKRLTRLAAPLLLLFGIEAEAGVLDGFWLHRAYQDYEHKEWNVSVSALSHVTTPSLQRDYARGALYYQQGAYKKAGRVFSSIRSRDPETKQKLYYNLGNCAAKLGRFESARDFYVKALQLGKDAQTLSNLETVMFLMQRQKKKPAIHANKSVKASGKGGSSEQKPGGAKRQSQASGQGQSGSGTSKSGGAEKVKKTAAPPGEKHPIGSKAYDLINKGYINETRPW
jgi:Ca-activated chloride channel homolog